MTTVFGSAYRPSSRESVSGVVEAIVTFFDAVAVFPVLALGVGSGLVDLLATTAGFAAATGFAAGLALFCAAALTGACFFFATAFAGAAFLTLFFAAAGAGLRTGFADFCGLRALAAAGFFTGLPLALTGFFLAGGAGLRLEFAILFSSSVHGGRVL